MSAEYATDCHDCGALSIVYYDEYAMGNPLKSYSWHFCIIGNSSGISCDINALRVRMCNLKKKREREGKEHEKKEKCTMEVATTSGCFV